MKLISRRGRGVMKSCSRQSKHQSNQAARPAWLESNWPCSHHPGLRLDSAFKSVSRRLFVVFRSSRRYLFNKSKESADEDYKTECLKTIWRLLVALSNEDNESFFILSWKPFQSSDNNFQCKNYTLRHRPLWWEQLCIFIVIEIKFCLQDVWKHFIMPEVHLRKSEIQFT